MSSLLTPEAIEAIAKNAGAMNDAINAANDTAAQNKKHHDSVAPHFIKFKFILCDVEIKNINAAAAEAADLWPQ